MSSITLEVTGRSLYTISPLVTCTPFGYKERVQENGKELCVETVASHPQSLFLLQHFSDQPPCSLSEEEVGLSQVV